MITERPDPGGKWAWPRWVVAAARSGQVETPDRLPVLLCKGLCSNSCGPAPMTPVEFDRVAAKIGRPLVVNPETLRCSALNDADRCDAYNDRPLICRLWGMSEGMMCPHGCVTTTGHYLTYPEAIGLLSKAEMEEGEMVCPELDL